MDSISENVVTFIDEMLKLSNKPELNFRKMNEDGHILDKLGIINGPCEEFVSSIRVTVSKPNLMHLNDYYYKMHKTDNSNGGYYVDVPLLPRPRAPSPFQSNPPYMDNYALFIRYSLSLAWDCQEINNDLNWFKFLVEDGCLPPLFPKKGV